MLRATHVVIVIAGGVSPDRIIVREFREILLRWYFELLPSVICVVQPGVARELRANRATPLELRFILTWCPRLTPEEATDRDILAYILRQRRRTGRLGDVMTLVSGF